MPKRSVTYTFFIFSLFLTTSSALGAGGPNLIEGTSIKGLWIYPGIGSFALFIMFIVINPRRAIATAITISTILLLLSTHPIALLGVVLLGPWATFITLIIVIYFSLQSDEESHAEQQNTTDKPQSKVQK